MFAEVMIVSTILLPYSNARIVKAVRTSNPCIEAWNRSYHGEAWGRWLELVGLASGCDGLMKDGRCLLAMRLISRDYYWIICHIAVFPACSARWHTAAVSNCLDKIAVQITDTVSSSPHREVERYIVFLFADF